MTLNDKTTEIVLGELSDVRPQDDLFKYVNGKFLENAVIPADQTSEGSFIKLRNQSEKQVKAIIEELAENGSDDPTSAKIADFFSSFMDEARVNALGAAPLEKDFELIAACTDKTQLAGVMGQLWQTGVGGIVGAEPEVDRNDPDNYILWMYQDGIGLPDEAFYRSEDFAEILAEYTKFIPRLYSLAKGVDDVEATEASGKILSLEKAIAASHFDVTETRDADKTNNIMTWDELKASAPGLDWDALMGGAGVDTATLEKVLVMTPRALTGAAAVWEHATVDELRTYMEWCVILARAPYLSEDIVRANFEFYGRTLNGQEEMRDRWKRGVSVVSGYLGEAIGKEYVARHFPPSHKAAMEQLVGDLVEAYRGSITELDWMTEETKVKALDKLDNFTLKIGYPDKWRDYSKLEIVPEDLVANVRAGNRFLFDIAYAKLGAPIDRDEWHMTPQTVNAYYNPVMNEIVFPAAILQPPFFDADADPAWNYGGIGAVIGHEIGHGFDDQGSKYDGTGRLNNWWTDADRTEFEARTSALVAQYEAYVPEQFPADSPHHVNGQLTLGENIGDLGGLSIALKAYDIAMKREGFGGAAGAPEILGTSGLRRVFLSWGRIWETKDRTESLIQRVATDPHSPGEFRCNGVVKNVDAFAEEFGVVEGDGLWLAPEDRVRIW